MTDSPKDVIPGWGPFEADAIQTAKDLDELAAHIEARYPGGAARCRRASKLIVELAWQGVPR